MPASLAFRFQSSLGTRSIDTRAATCRIRDDIKRLTGLPTRIGLGPTRTLSKVANGLSKAGEKVFGGVIDLHDADLRRHLLRN